MLKAEARRQPGPPDALAGRVVDPVAADGVDESSPATPRAPRSDHGIAGDDAGDRASARPAGPRVLVPGAERPCRRRRMGEILIRTAHAGDDRPDALQRAGVMRRRRRPAHLPGLESAGTVVAVGPGVARVAGRGPRSARCFPVVGMRECAADLCRACVAGSAGSGHCGRRRAPPSVLHRRSTSSARGARAGGVPRRMAARRASGRRRSSWPRPAAPAVFATAGIGGEMRGLRSAGGGAGHPITATRISLRSRRRRTGGRGVDVILDMVGGDYLGPRRAGAG